MASGPKVAVVTGARQGIGAGLVAGLRGIGCGVVASSRFIGTDDPGGDPAVLAVAGGIAAPDTAERVVGAAMERFDRIVA